MQMRAGNVLNIFVLPYLCELTLLLSMSTKLAARIFFSTGTERQISITATNLSKLLKYVRQAFETTTRLQS
jgi:hypothetical protein